MSGRNEVEVAESDCDQQEPPQRAHLKPRTRREDQNARDAAGDIHAVSLQPVGPAFQCAAELLSRTNEGEGEHEKEEAAKHFDRNRITRQILALILRAEVDLLRPRLIANVNELHERAAADLDADS